jgi:hypothetical protein
LSLFETIREIIKVLGINEEGQVEGKNRSFSDHTLRRDEVGRVAHALDQRQRDRETKTCSFKDPSRTGVSLEKGLKDVLLDFFIHPDSSVDHLELEHNRPLFFWR